MVVEFTTTHAISAYCHLCYEFESRSWRDVLDTTVCDKVYQCLAAGQWFSSGTIYVHFQLKRKTKRNNGKKILDKYSPLPIRK
jgi:hypothetical protein